MNKQLGQWMTPEWAAEYIVETQFPNLGAHDLVVEPTCGRGAFLKAIPSAAEAIGCEIDPELAAIARTRSGRPVVTGDFRIAPLVLPTRPTLIIGNPPFKSETIAGILQRSFELLEWEGMAAFILPAYVLQTPKVVMQYAERWSMQADLLPRTLFPRLSQALVFARFRKSETRIMVGFALYSEAHAVERMAPEMRRLLADGELKPTGRSLWRAVVELAMQELGGEAGLDAIYASISPRRPTANVWWKPKVRQVLQQHFVRTGAGRYAHVGTADPIGIAA